MPSTPKAQINSNHFQKNIQTKERYDRPQNSPSASSHLWSRGFPDLKGCLYNEKAFHKLVHHLGIYIHFIKNVLGQRFHSLVGCDKNRPCLFWASCLAIYSTLSTPKPHQINPWQRRMVWGCFLLSQLLFEINNLAYKLRDQPVQRNYSDGQFPFPLEKKKTNQNNTFPQVEVEKEEAGTWAPEASSCMLSKTENIAIAN